MSPGIGSQSLLVHHIFVEEGSRRQGIGSLVFNHVKDYCRENNINVIEMYAPPKNIPDYHTAISFYKKFGANLQGTGFKQSIICE